MLILRKIKQLILQKPRLVAHLSVAVFLAVVVFSLNPFQPGSVIAQGDFYQLINIKENFRNYLFTWFYHSGQGQFNPLTVAFPFYFLQMLLEEIGLEYSQIAQVLAFGFLYGAFLSFYFSLRLISKLFINRNKLGGIVSFWGGLIYALNIFTFNVLSFSYGYLHHFLIYLFIPPLMAVFLSCLLKRKKEYYFIMIIVFFLSTVSFNNIAFLAALFLFEGLVFALAYFLEKFDKKILVSFLVVLVLQIILSLYFLAPFVASQIEYAEKIETTESFGGDAINNIRTRSNSLLEVFGLNTQKYHFPGLNYFSSNFWGKLIPQALNFLPIILILFWLYFWKNKKNNWQDLKISIIILLVFFLSIILVARITSPFEAISEFLFRLPGFLLFRSPDKIQVFFQYFLTLSLVLAISFFDLKKKTANIIFILLLLIPFPFYFGGINKYLNWELDKNLLEPSDNGYKISVEIPQEYKEVAKKINQSDEDTAIISLPYAKVNSLNWSNYPKWNFVGHDFLYLLYNKRYISANSYDHPLLETRLSFKEVNERSQESRYLLEEVKKFGARYIMFHKDIPEDWFLGTEKIRFFLENLEEAKKLKKIEENDYFILYELSEENILPPISVGSDLIFEKINPTKYKISIKNIKGKEKLNLLQSFNSQWKLYLKPINEELTCNPIYEYVNFSSRECRSSKVFFEGEEISYLFKNSIFEEDHSLDSNFSNQWEINPEFIKNNFSNEYYRENSDKSLDFNIIIYFLPQSYFYLGIIIDCFLVFVSLIFLNIYFLRKN